MTVALRRLDAIAEFEQCVRIQREIWGFADVDIVPRRMFVVAAATGGFTIGAFTGEKLAGYALTLPGFRHADGSGPRLYYHSHMLAVVPEFRNAGLGRRLKLRQRELALEAGIDTIEWTFDPLEIKNGYFNIARLGAIARRYLDNLYGATTSALQAGLPSDRLVAEWHLRSPRVGARIRGAEPHPDAAAQRVPVPAALADWKSRGEPAAVQEQARIRAQLHAAFDRGLAITAYEKTAAGGAFVLEPVPELNHEN